MSDPKKAEPDEDLLEFLGGIDEVNEGLVNEGGQDGDFSDFLAKTDIERIASDKKPKPPAKSDPPPKPEAGK